MNQRLKNKKALITGGSRGIGKVIAEYFLKEGAKVMLAARSFEELKITKAELKKNISVNQRKPASFIGIQEVDVADPEQVKNLIEKTVSSLGGIDILVNAAGIYGPIGPSHEVDLNEWKKTYEINLFGTFSIYQNVIPAMKKTGGKIINFSGGGDGPLPNFSAYNSSKAAVTRLTETLAEEVKEYNIDINVVAPGAVNTHFLDIALEAGEEKTGKERYQKLLEQKKSGGTPPEKTAELCVFLASSDSDGLTGKYLSSVWDKWKTWDKAKIAKIMKSDIFTLKRVK